MSNLNPQQFENVPLHELDHYTSADFETPMHAVPEELKFREEFHGTGEDYERHTGGPTNVTGYINDLAAHMSKHGSPAPLEAHADNVITDGHHRYAAARVAGLTHLPVKRVNENWF